MLTQQRLKQVLKYDPDTGLFTWLWRRGSIQIGDPAGHLHPSGYISISVDGEPYRAHRLAFLWMLGRWPEKTDVDHINRNRSDNRWTNLREATRSENLFNSQRRSDNSTGQRGVYFNKSAQKFKVEIWCDGDRYHLGYFDDLVQATAMYEGAARLVHGEFKA